MKFQTVFTFILNLDPDCDPQDRQERYVVADSEDEAIEKFHQYLMHQKALGFAEPASYSYYPTVELMNVIV